MIGEMNVFAVVTQIGQYVLLGVGLAVTLYKTYNTIINFKSFSWRDVDAMSKRIINIMSNDMYIPDVIVGIGRGGAIVGALLSGNMAIPNKKQNIPLLGVDRIYEWRNGRRIELHNPMVELGALAGKRVLLVAADVSSGDTMKMYLQTLREQGVSEIKTAALLKNVAATFKPDYYAREIAGTFRMPWMYRGYGYVLDSRKPLRE